MALPILDGNQSATTLSTILTGGEHTPAHTVVSLGSTAISNITSAVSGSVVSVSNFPSTQTIAGTVTANVVGSKNVEASVYDSGKVIPVQVVRFSDGELIGDSVPLAISGTVTVGGFSSVSVGSGAILAAGSRSGTITPIPLDTGSGRVAGSAVVQYNVGGPTPYQDVTSSFPLPVQVVSQGSVTIGSLPAISGTVTANIGSVLGFSEIYLSDADNDNRFSSSNPFPISGTVTVGAMPNGSLTTRFGTPTTANTAFATSAVTNTSRKYLLIQNVTTGGNVITVGIGFTPTTTQGIQLTAGAGITFESSYIPTGAVMILSSVTASNFTILEA